MKRELEILESQSKISNNVELLNCDHDKKILKMKFVGTSLYENFVLPKNWEIQIRQIFSELTEHNIFYPEFRLQNILVLNDKITFIDFGLAKIHENVNNGSNCDIFIELLSLLSKKFSTVDDPFQKHILYTTFINNIKFHNMTKYLNNVF
jgi:tRNA A-37 threonylcarbamoyl transferase component Bud32